MVALSVKLPFDDNDVPDEDNVDEDGDTQVANEISTKDRLRPIRLNLGADIEISMQYEVYGTDLKEVCLRRIW